VNLWKSGEQGSVDEYRFQVIPSGCGIMIQIDGRLNVLEKSASQWLVFAVA
jgi:hypothetical protein